MQDISGYFSDQDSLNALKASTNDYISYSIEFLNKKLTNIENNFNKRIDDLNISIKIIDEKFNVLKNDVKKLSFIKWLKIRFFGYEI